MNYIIENCIPACVTILLHACDDGTPQLSYNVVCYNMAL